MCIRVCICLSVIDYNDTKFCIEIGSSKKLIDINEFLKLILLYVH